MILALFLLSAALFAQVDTGNISGTVKDAAGAVVAGARVAMRNAGTGIRLVVNKPNATAGAPGAGTIRSAGAPLTFQRTSRQIQFALKFYF